jgi:uncharacterized protein with PIN domain
MLGRLARWLRIMGYDTEYFPEIGDAELVARAEQSGRVILTRDTLLVGRKKARDSSFFVTGDHFRDQLRQVAAAFSLDPFTRFLTRCLECNAPLHDIDRKYAEGQVPPFVAVTQESIRGCTICGRFYWGGTHRERMVEELREILELKS